MTSNSHLKIGAKFLIYTLLLLFLSSNISYGQNKRIRYVTSNLNLRESPSVSSNRILTIPKGTVIVLDEDCNCEWIPVKYKEYIGFVYTKYLSKNKVSNYSSQKYYTNSRGEKVKSPSYSNKIPPGATALCRDGTYSFSRSRRGTCSHHGGVKKWLH